jgi:hypothetical protein
MMLVLPVKRKKERIRKVLYRSCQWKAVLMSMAAAVFTSLFLRRFILNGD